MRNFIVLSFTVTLAMYIILMSSSSVTGFQKVINYNRNYYYNSFIYLKCQPINFSIRYSIVNQGKHCKQWVLHIPTGQGNRKLVIGLNMTKHSD